MSLALFSLLIALVAVVLTTGVGVLLRSYGALTGRRRRSYRVTLAEELAAFAVGASERAPRAPRNRVERRLVHEELARVAHNLKGTARDALRELFAAYGLADSTRRALTSRSAVTAIHAADLAGIIGAQECIPLLIARLSAPDPLVRLACARALGELGCSEAIAQIVQALASGEHATELSEILIGFGAIAEPLLCDRLRRCERSEERWLAALTLGELHARGAVADLVAVLEDPDEELVARAARALGRIGDACAVAPLTAILARQRSWFVDVAAATALGKLEDPAGAPALAQTLCSDDWSVRNAAARSLAVLGDAGVLAVLKRAGGVLAPEPIAHFAGVLDVSDRLERLLERAAAGEAEMDQFARAACASGVRSRLIELASERDDRVGAYASSVLARAGAGA